MRPALILALSLSLAACSGRDAPAPAPVQNVQAPSEKTPAEKAPTETAPPAPAPDPPLAQQGRVTDAANILDETARTALTARLAAFEQRTKHQMVIATLPTLNGADIGAYTRDLANHWGVGRKGHDDGIVILVAPNDKQVRIAVGYGLEKALPETLCRQIIQDHMLPAFAGGDFAGGLDKGLTALIGAMDEGKKPPNDQPSSISMN